ncbi:MAG: hypothetical protein HQ446_05510 [Polaromonas sp.]|nr:hypothetical protein [Polaromonas sp.]
MTFKKLALVALMASSFSVYAENVGVLPIGEAYDYTTAAPLLQDEFLAATVEGNQAYVVQEGSGNLAYINQATEEASFAAIVQADEGGLALIYQTGALGNKALIMTKGATGGDAAAYDVASLDTFDKVATLGKGALHATQVPVMNDTANVAVINQASDAAFNVAYIDQNVGDATVNSNFAAIAQTAGTFNNLGMIAQIGSLNKALILQSN